jgi:succinoglycan biosynthesis transport protein ExoP
MHSMPPVRPTHRPPAAADDGGFLVQEEESVTLRDYWIILRKYRWTIVICFLPIVLITALSQQGKAPVYSATATLYMDNQTPNIMGVIGATSGFNYAGSAGLDYYKTQANLLRSRSLAAQVIRDLGLDQGKRFDRAMQARPTWFESQVSWAQSQVSWAQSQLSRSLDVVASWFEEPSQEDSGPVRDGKDKSDSEDKSDRFEFRVNPSLIDRYLSGLWVERVAETQMFKVSFSSLDPAFSQEVANAHATAFIRTNLLTRFELTAEGRQFLEQKLTELKAKLEKSEAALNRFRKAHSIVSLERGENLVVDRLRGLNGDLTQTRSKRIELETLYRIVQQRDSLVISQIIENPVVRQIKDQISTLEMEKARIATTYKPTYPAVTALQERIDQIKNRLDQEVRRIVRSITADYHAANAREKALVEAMEEQRRAALDLQEKAVEATILEREVESDRSIYENVLKRSKETDLTGAVPISNVRVVDRADDPRYPDADRRKRNLALGVFVGLMGGVGLAFLRHYLDNTLKTPEDVGRYLHFPTLGLVPDIRRLGRRASVFGSGRKPPQLPEVVQNHNRANQALMIPHHPLLLAGESYQAICTALLFSLAGRPPRTILITSSQAKEGKTVTAINVAATLARNGASVLLIDADLRNGICHRMLGLQNGSGLTNTLAGNLDINDRIKATAITNLSLLSRGNIPPNPTELLGSEKMRQLLDALETSFAFIVIDSAPLLPITDSVLLATKVDGVVLVTRAQALSRHVVRQACERLAYVRAKVLGVILNAVDIQNPEYKDYRSSFQSYYTSYLINSEP